MELELKKLEDLSEAIVNDFAYMRAREEQMRDTNGKIDCDFQCFLSLKGSCQSFFNFLTRQFLKHTLLKAIMT